MNRFILTVLFAMLLSIALSTASHADEAESRLAFDRLKSLAGNWEDVRQGEGEAEGEAAMAPEITHEFKIASAGTVVMETMSPGSNEEMINMYHLDGDTLMVTHYCAGGNQPAMRLNTERSSADQFFFEFIGGTNLDPEVDSHIHSIRIDLLGPDKIESSFEGYSGGEPAGTMHFALARN